MALLHFALTLFVSAFILFLVQPLIGKLVLPKLGGTPQVWNTCMVFFQMVLLLGYGYTHFVSTKLKPRAQVMLHGVVVLLPFLVFWFWPMYMFIKEWIPNLGGNPILGTLLLLATVVGIPFFVVSTTAPLLQKWFGFTGHEAAKDPYFLYGASNLGSMLSLVVYPVLIEPFSYLQTQTFVWMGGYAALVILVFIALAMVWKPTGLASASQIEGERPEISTLPVTGEVLAGAIQSKPSPKIVPPLERRTPEDYERVDGWRRFRWILLAAVPSSMMLGITSHITTDLSPMPMFWLIPLAFYLLSFILVFARWPVIWVEKPHSIMLMLQPLCIALMLLIDMVHLNQHGDSEGRVDLTWWVVAFDIIAFVATVMVCHGELAKDRPSVRYLTDFYLMMSIGGVVGGILNGIIAPLLPWVFELNLAIIAACLLRPNMPFGNWIDALVSGMADKTPAPSIKKKGKDQPIEIAKTESTGAISYGLDVVIGIGVFVLAFLINMIFSNRDSFSWLVIGYVAILVITVSCFARGLRFGLAVTGIILAFEWYLAIQDGRSTLYRSRSYFGVIRVNRSADPSDSLPFTTLMHGHINHGQNYLANSDPTRDFSRLATTYYHRKGPAGIVMEKFNWFHPESNNDFCSDARMPAGIIAQAAFASLGASNLPLGELVEAWTEPPYATIGLGTGTMASYGRPFQHVHFYEIDDQIRRLSTTLPTKEEPYFTYLKGAKERGANVQVLMGDARQRMHLPYGNYDEAEVVKPKVPVGGPENFYHMMVVDAFSSDAIPAHLLTKEAFEMYFKHLTKDGILCVHTSNRFVDLPRVVADTAANLGYVCLRGHDSSPNAKDPKNRGRFTSEWVMVARNAKNDNPNALEYDYLKELKAPQGYAEELRKTNRQKGYRPPSVDDEAYWNIPRTYGGKYLWTDDYYNLLSILRLFTGPRDQ